MNQVNAGLVCTGIIDGTTVVYDIAVVDAKGQPVSLTQYYDEAKCTPDWENIYLHGTAEEKATMPRIIIRAFDTTSGIDITNTLKMTNVYYNEQLVGFTDDISDAQGGVPGILKIDTYSYKGTDIPCIMVIGNPADALLNPDDDRISFDGSVVSSGGQISFAGIGKDIAIRPIADANAGYSVELHVPLDIPKFIMTKDNNQIESTQRLARLYYNGVPVSASDMEGYQFKFYDITGPTEIQLTGTDTDITIGHSLVNGDLITIGPEAVDCLLTLRCRVFDKSGNELASGTSAVYDLSDPYMVKWLICESAAGTNGIELTGLEPRLTFRTGQTKYIFPKLYTDKGDTFHAGSSASMLWSSFSPGRCCLGPSFPRDLSGAWLHPQRDACGLSNDTTGHLVWEEPEEPTWEPAAAVLAPPVALWPALLQICMSRAQRAEFHDSRPISGDPVLRPGSPWPPCLPRAEPPRPQKVGSWCLTVAGTPGRGLSLPRPPCPPGWTASSSTRCPQLRPPP